MFLLGASLLSATARCAPLVVVGGVERSRGGDGCRRYSGCRMATFPVPEDEENEFIDPVT